MTAMQIDIPTLYNLTIGTLWVAVAMTTWERMTALKRRRELGLWALAYGVLALGCLVMTERARFPGVTGSALTNLVILAGYVLLLAGAARFDGRAPPRWPVALLVCVGLAWILFGARFPAAFWHHVASLPIALVCGATAWILWTGPTLRDLATRRLAGCIAGGHGLFYLARAFVMPFVAIVYGAETLRVMAMATMFEAVLFSVAMPMALLALVREEAHGQLLAASRTDYLTGLGNRHAFFETGALAVARRSAGPVALIALDLDHFKSINDRHGHATGDAILKLFAEIMRHELGSDAACARLGGEEFAALLVGPQAEDAWRLADGVRRQLSRQTGKGGGALPHATVSIGIACLDDRHGDLADLLSEADGALYRAKRFGRNRVEAADGFGEPPGLIARPA